jgi:3-oxoadipate enol-lactonase
MTETSLTPYAFLHPLGADRRFWDPVRAQLDWQPSVALDLPGHGSAASQARDAGIEDFAAAVAAQLTAPAHVVGMSLGGVIAQQLALDRPDLVRSVVLVDTVPVYPAPMRQMWRERAETARRGGLSSLVEPMVEMWFSAELAAVGDQRVVQARQTFTDTDAEGYARSCDLLADVDVSARLPALTVPAVVVCGQDDTPPFRDAARWMADAAGDGVVHWLPGKHACAVEEPVKFAALLTATT